MGMVKYLLLLECLECMRIEKIVHIELNYEFFAQIGHCNLLAMRSQSDGVGVCLNVQTSNVQSIIHWGSRPAIIDKNPHTGYSMCVTELVHFPSSMRRVRK